MTIHESVVGLHGCLLPIYCCTAYFSYTLCKIGAKAGLQCAARGGGVLTLQLYDCCLGHLLYVVMVAPENWLFLIGSVLLLYYLLYRFTSC